ncbi:MAG: PAS domain S-box protein [Actinobacteria bacterium]|nr:PAS domain S-box protein [Actinomycetota bacterium]
MRPPEEERSSEDLYDLYENAPVAYFEIDSDGRIRHANEAAGKLLGYRGDELLGRSVFDLYTRTASGTERAHEAFSRYLAGEEIREELEMRTADGRSVWIQLLARPVLDGEGRVVRSRSVAVDITDRKLAEERLREAEARYRSLVENLPSIVYRAEIGAGGRWLYVSPRIASILGFSAQEWMADPALWLRQLHPEDRDRVLAEERTSFTSGEPLVTEYRLVSRDGRTLWFWDEASVVTDENGQPLFLQGHLSDITQRKQAEEELRESDRRLRELLENVHLIAVGVDLDGRVTFCNDYLARLIGWTEEELRGRDWFEVLAPDPRGLEMRAAFTADASGGPVPAYTESSILTRHGVRRVVSWNHTTLRDRSGNVIGTISIGEDVTEARRAEDSLRATVRRLQGLRDASLAIGAARSVAEIASASAEHARGIALAHLALVSLTEDEGCGQVIEAVSSSTRGRAGRDRPEPPGWSMLAAEACRAKAPLRLTEEESEARGLAEAAPPGRGVLLAPLQARDGTGVGAIQVWWSDRDGFDEADEGAIVQLAQMASIAIENQTLFREAQEARTRMGDYAEELEQRLAELRRSDQERRRLLSRLVEAQDRERRGIAADIHDDSIQVMAAALLRLSSLRARLEHPEQAEAMARLEETIRQSISRLRRLVFELQPVVLEREGLSSAMRLYLEWIKEDTGLDYTFTSNLPTEPSTEVRTILYRLAHEALANVRKHARASRVDVVVEEHDHGVLVRIQDDGRGFDPARAGEPEPGHLGLPDMRERAELARGWLRIESAPGSGATVEFWVPTDDVAGPAVDPGPA